MNRSSHNVSIFFLFADRLRLRSHQRRWKGCPWLRRCRPRMRTLHSSLRVAPRKITLCCKKQSWPDTYRTVWFPSSMLSDQMRRQEQSLFLRAWDPNSFFHFYNDWSNLPCSFQSIIKAIINQMCLELSHLINILFVYILVFICLSLLGFCFF